MTCVDEIYIHPTTIEIHKGEWSFDAKAYILPENATCKSVRWSSGNSSVATVNETTGYIYGAGVGKTAIYATACDGSGKYGACEVTVDHSILVSSLKLEVSKMTLKKGKTYTFSPTILPADAINKTLRWYSSNTSVATISDSGVLSAVALGTTQITAVTTDGSVLIASCDVKVTEKQLVNSITFSVSGISVYTGKTKSLTATVLPSDAENKTVTWSSSAPDIAAVDATTGKVTGVSAGTATIYATATDGSGIKGSYSVTVKTYVPATRITVTPERVTLALNEKADITASIYPTNTTTKTVTWTGGGSIVDVDGNGNTVTVTAKEAGTVELIASCDGVSSKCVVTVDMRERVKIEEDHTYDKVYYQARFEDGTVWNIIAKTKELDYAREKDFEARRNANQAIDFSVERLAFLYMIDPLGVEFYMRNYEVKVYEDDNDKIYQQLVFKDLLFFELYGKHPVLFKKLPSGTIEYELDYSDSINDGTRRSFYSYAELLFGDHSIYGNLPEALLIDVCEAVVGCVDSISMALSVLDLNRAIFFSGGVVNEFGGLASEFYGTYAKEIGNTALEKMLGWPLDVVNFICDASSTINDAFKGIDSCQVQIFDSVSKKNYSTNFLVNNSNYSLEDILSFCET